MQTKRGEEVLEPYDLDAVEFVGHGLARPECALAHRSGMIFAPDWTQSGGVSCIYPDGTVRRHLVKTVADNALDEPIRPNGICLLEGGDFLLAHLGQEKGGVFRLSVEGTLSAELTHVDGMPLPPTNFVTIDEMHRTWITVSTRQSPRALAYRHDVADGFVVLKDRSGARIAADNLGYTNECMVHPNGRHLYVNETFARRLTRFDIAQNGRLTNPKTLARFGKGTFPDGLAFDGEGNAWITSIVSNRVICVNENGSDVIFLEDVGADHLDWVEHAYSQHNMGRPHLDTAAGKRLHNISNLAFCGEQLDRAVLGCLLGEQLAVMDVPIAGHQPVHWTFDISPLISALEAQPILER